MKKVLSYISFLALAGFSACSMEKEIDLNLPEFQSELAVEGYLEDGQPYRVAVYESTSYFDRPEPILVPDATVIITHHGQADTLKYNPYYDKETEKFYTHTSKTKVIGQPGESYALEVFDARGRRLTGFAQFLPKVNIDSIEWKFNSDGKALLNTTFKDEGSTTDAYRFQIHEDTLTFRRRLTDRFTSDRLNNGGKMLFGTSYRFFPNDTLFVTLYHIENPYYNFLSTLDDAQEANGNPFAQPSAIKSTVQGGIGVFTTLTYDRKQVILK
jgi:hypothetical protein